MHENEVPSNQTTNYLFLNDHRTSHFCGTVKRKQKHKKRVNTQKARKIQENWSYQGQTPIEENKTDMKSNLSFEKMVCHLSIEILKHKLTETRLANLTNPLSFF